MDFIRVTQDNIEKEHICCAIASNKDVQVIEKKNWLKDRLEEGLVFLKGNERGKCFIEYIPAEYAWIPIEAAGYMYIDCLWVSGKFKGHGYANELLHTCIQDSKEKGKKGLVVLSSAKKLSFLSDHKFMEYKGFQVADSADPYFELLYLPFEKNTNVPHFKDSIKKEQLRNMNKGFVLYYSSQCPFTAKYVPLLVDMAKDKQVKFQAIHVETREQAQSIPTPFTTFSLFYDGEFITHEILSEKKFEKILLEKCK